MKSIYDYKRFAILYVDDEELSLKYFTKAMGKTFRIFTATNAAEGYRILLDHQEEIGVVMSDQRMPGEQGTQFLERARRLQPRIIRILATAFADLNAAIEAVNTGAIYKYVTKPWELPNLEMTLKRSMEFFIVQLERDLLLRQKLSALHRMLIADRILSLGVLAAGLGQRLRNTLDAIRRFLELAPEMLQGEQVDIERLQNPDFWRDFHRHVQSQVRTVFSLVEGITEDAERPLVFDAEVRLAAVVNQCVEELGPELKQRSLHVINHIPADLPPLRVDGVRFRRLFELLLRDALINLAEGCEVRFEASLRPGSDGESPEVELVVSDNGGGLPSAAVLSVLDPLVERGVAAGDFGLNLMACYFIVYHHGGRVQLQSGAGEGTSFVITLPLTPPVEEPRLESEEFLLRAMTNERLWERLIAGG
ncbi:MAG: hybrid sensor histidine kinase/response regulator [Verrucomicrobiales bacterium]|nr:hybrid sensor histidine kinase/response regulator [Verrucomicrobiales bacterium]